MVNIAKRLAHPKNMVMLGVRRTVKGVEKWLRLLYMPGLVISADPEACSSCQCYSRDHVDRLP